MLQGCSVSKEKRMRDVEEEPTKVKKKTDVTSSLHDRSNVEGRVIFILDNAALKKGLVKKKWKILNSEEDADFLLRQNKNLDHYRTDIVYEALRSILDSPLNKVGMIGAVYVKIEDGVLFEVKPYVRLPRSLKRFCGIVLELLERKYVRAKDTNEILLRVVEEPVTRHLPANSRIIGLSYHSDKVVDIDDYVSTASDDLNLVFVLGAMVHGTIDKQYTNDFLSVSEYPLGAKCCVGVICDALEEKWKIY